LLRCSYESDEPVHASVNADALLATAKALAGVDEVRDDSFYEGLERFASAFAAQDGLTNLGRNLAEGQAVGNLANRLSVDEYVAHHPEVLDRPVERPLVILGMPRTGTTLVVNLLAQVPSLRPLLNWEGLTSVPPPEATNYDRDPRLVVRRQQLRALRETGPLAAVHWEEADDPAECTVLHQQDFKALVLTAFVSDPSYAEWLLSVDVSSTYRYEKRALQVLQWNVRGRWLLKMPAHAVHLEELFAEFPDADVVVCHRDPTTALASACSQRGRFHQMVFDRVDREAIRSTSLRVLVESSIRPIRWRDAHGGDRFYDVHYADLLSDPVGQLRKITEYFGEPWSRATEESALRRVRDRPQSHYGRHHYSADEYGIRREEVEPLFAEYLSRYEALLNETTTSEPSAE